MAPSDPGGVYPVGRGAVSVVNSLYVIFPVAMVLGFLSGLGTGGGSLLILWLTLVLGLPYVQARAMNLMFFLPSAVIACLFRWRQGKLDLKKVLPGILAGCIAAGLCSLFTAGQTPDSLKKVFGILLIFTGIRELLYKKRGR